MSKLLSKLCRPTSPRYFFVWLAQKALAAPTISVCRRSVWFEIPRSKQASLRLLSLRSRLNEDLGVLLDFELNTKKHINKVTSTCCYQLRHLRHIRLLIGHDLST